MGDKFTFYNLQHGAFTIFIVIIYFLYAVSIIGLSTTAPKYIETLDSYIKIYICLFLIYRFNPFRSRIEFTELDRKIVFSAGLFILATTTINKIALTYLDNIRYKINEKSNKIFKN